MNRVRRPYGISQSFIVNGHVRRLAGSLQLNKQQDSPNHRSLYVLISFLRHKVVSLVPGLSVSPGPHFEGIYVAKSVFLVVNSDTHDLYP